MREGPMSRQREGARPPHRAWEYPVFATASRASRRELGHSPRGFPRIGGNRIKKRSPGSGRGLVSVGKHDLESHVLLDNTPRIPESRGMSDADDKKRWAQRRPASGDRDSLRHRAAPKHKQIALPDALVVLHDCRSKSKPIILEVCRRES